MEQRIIRLKEEFIKCFNSEGVTRIFQVPGRVNLIGEHTDYNGGFVMPMAIDRSILAIARSRSDRKVRMKSLNFNNEVNFDLDNINNTESDGWGNYPKGVARMLEAAGYRLGGMDMLFEGDIPVASGLSSSAAIEVLSGWVFTSMSGKAIDKKELVLLCQKAENEFIGVKCGIMDQFVVGKAEKNSVLFLDCRDLSYELVPFNFEDVYVIISNTNVKRKLVNSEYNNRRKECEEGVKFFNDISGNIKQLRDVSVELFEKYKHKLPRIVANRCEHVIYENERVKKAILCLKNEDASSFGQLMIQSHNSLRDLYEVSCKELDILVENALKIDGVLGSRMTGAGFGGCTVSLVQKDSAERFIVSLTEKYRKGTNIKPEFYICRPEAGVKEI